MSNKIEFQPFSSVENRPDSVLDSSKRKKMQSLLEGVQMSVPTMTKGGRDAQIARLQEALDILRDNGSFPEITDDEILETLRFPELPPIEAKRMLEMYKANAVNSIRSEMIRVVQHGTPFSVTYPAGQGRLGMTFDKDSSGKVLEIEIKADSGVSLKNAFLVIDDSNEKPRAMLPLKVGKISLPVSQLGFSPFELNGFSYRLLTES